MYYIIHDIKDPNAAFALFFDDGTYHPNKRNSNGWFSNLEDLLSSHEEGDEFLVTWNFKKVMSSSHDLYTFEHIPTLEEIKSIYPELFI